MHGRSETAPTPWRDEIRAMVSLAWPLILTNVSQSLIQATDVLLLGRVGARTLAAAQLGVNLFVAFLIFGMGLVMAASPMMAKQLGMRPHSVRDVRRTVRQALWAATAITLPFWLVLWHTEAILVAMGEDPGLAGDDGRFAHTLQWAMLPALYYLVLRSFVAALERPGWSLAVGLAGAACNATINYALIFGMFGMPALGLTGAGIGTTCTNIFM